MSESRTQSNVDLSVIIVSWNTCGLLRDCIKSIIEYTKKLQYEIWVVDNNSQDDTVTMLEAEFPQVNLIKNDQNVGFSRANNQAFAISTGKYIALLNPDTVLINDAFDMMVEFLEKHPGYGAVGPKLIGVDGHPQPASARKFPTLWDDFIRVITTKTDQKHCEYPLDRDQDVEAVSGACIVLNREALNGQLLAEAYFMYGEDLELCWRIRETGFKIRYWSEVNLIHHKGASSTQVVGMNYVAASNYYLFRRRTGGFLIASFVRIAIGIGAMVRIPIGLWVLIMSRDSSRQRTYLKEQLMIFQWAVGLRRGFYPTSSRD